MLIPSFPGGPHLRATTVAAALTLGAIWISAETAARTAAPPKIARRLRRRSRVRVMVRPRVLARAPPSPPARRPAPFATPARTCSRVTDGSTRSITSQAVRWRHRARGHRARAQPCRLVGRGGAAGAPARAQSSAWSKSSGRRQADRSARSCPAMTLLRRMRIRWRWMFWADTCRPSVLACAMHRQMWQDLTASIRQPGLIRLHGASSLQLRFGAGSPMHWCARPGKITVRMSTVSVRANHHLPPMFFSLHYLSGVHPLIRR